MLSGRVRNYEKATADFVDYQVRCREIVEVFVYFNKKKYGNHQNWYPRCKPLVAVVYQLLEHHKFIQLSWTQVLRKCKPCLRCAIGLQWWETMELVPGGNKIKHLSSVNHFADVIHKDHQHHHHHYHHHHHSLKLEQ